MINRYFDSAALILIHKMDLYLQGFTDEEIRKYINAKLCEFDIARRLGEQFGDLARFPMQGTKGKDIIVDSLGFMAEIKFWKQYYGGKRKKDWVDAYQEPFDWITDEIKTGKKGKRIFICCWFTAFPLYKIMQLGSHRGGRNRNGNTFVSEKKLDILPFFRRRGNTIGSVETDYRKNSGKIAISYCEDVIDWELFGNSDNVLNIVMLF